MLKTERGAATAKMDGERPDDQGAADGPGVERGASMRRSHASTDAGDSFEGPMGALIRDRDWSGTSLGPIDLWPRSLISYVSMILRLPTPAIIFWGSDQVQLYNDGYAVIMGPRHPKYLGATYRECWPETYPTIHPWMAQVLQGEVVEVENTLVTLTRHGFTEEAYFTFSFSPLRDDEERIAGILQPVVEVTRTLLGARRRDTLRALAPAADPQRSSTLRVAEALTQNAHDIPFALLYLPDGPGGSLRLAAAAGLSADARLAAIPDAAMRAFAGNVAVEIDVGDAIGGAPHAGPWGDPTRRAIALPIRRSAGEAPGGVILLGISPRLRFDEEYRQFFEALAREIAANLVAEHARAARLQTERAREDLESFFMRTPAPLAILSGPEHRFELANRSMHELIGMDVDGKRIADLFDAPEIVAPFVRRLDQVYATGEPFVGRELPFRRPRKDGGADELLVNVSYTPLRQTDGTVSGILVFGYDITREVVARRHAEALAAELAAALHTRDEFLGIASHELRTPLTALKLQLQLSRRRMTGTETPGQMAATFDGLLKQTGRLVRLVEDMLDISRIDAGKLSLDFARHDLSTLVGDVFDRFAPQLAAARSVVRRDLLQPLPGFWDLYRLEQVITNLITNVLRYAPGTPIDIGTRREGDSAVLSVRDYGPGIPAGQLERIFGRFERAAGKDVSGLGLGLFIARQIVEAHGGEIHAENAEGGGARFVVRLPLRQPEPFRP